MKKPQETPKPKTGGSICPSCVNGAKACAKTNATSCSAYAPKPKK